jgi:hypothetical protein
MPMLLRPGSRRLPSPIVPSILSHTRKSTPLARLSEQILSGIAESAFSSSGHPYRGTRDVTLGFAIARYSLTPSYQLQVRWLSPKSVLKSRI